MKKLIKKNLELWDPVRKLNISQLDAVQRRAARFVTNCYDKYNTSVTALIQHLDWDSLETRRSSNRLTAFL